MKKILLITDFFRPEPGGIEGFFTELARNWQSDRIRVCVTAPEMSGITTPMDRLRFDNSENYTVDRISTGDEVPYRRKMRSIESALNMILDRFEPEHVIAGNISSGNLRALRMIAARGVPFSLFIANGGDLKKIRGFNALLYRGVIGNASNFFTLSRFFAARIAGSGISQEKIAVLPPAAERRVPVGRADDLPDGVRKLLNKNRIITGLGPLMPWKGFENAIEALSLLRARMKRVHLVIAGSGPEYAYLNELIRLRGLGDHVTLTGLLPEISMRALLSNTDLLIQPNGHPESREQGLGSAVIEAARYGIPSVIGRGGAWDELVEEGITGYLVDGRDPAEIAERIFRIFSNEDERADMGQHAKKKFRAGYRIDYTIEALLGRLDRGIRRQ